MSTADIDRAYYAVCYDAAIVSSLRGKLVIAAIVVFAVAVAWLIRFGCDDAYISFHYARNLVHGQGPTWFGNHIEGYTNFAWVLWSAAGIAAHLDPLVWAWAGSLASLAVALVVTYRFAQLRTGDVAAACAAAILATNFTFLAFGTKAKRLETMLQTALIAIAMWLVQRLRGDPPTALRLAGLSIVVALALWTRLDSAVACSVVGVVIAHRLVTTRPPLRSWLAAIVPALVLVGGWLVWKLAYYGDLLPNTYYVKVGTGRVAQGASYTGAFLHAYALWPLLAIAAVVAIVRRRFASGFPATIVAVWIAYVIVVGGDFMEFRFFVPILPAIAVVIAELVTQPSTRGPSARLRAVAVIAILGAFSLRHALTFQGAADFSYDSIHKLATFYGRVTDDDWGRLGRPLHAALDGTNATIACNGAGAIPYYAELPTIDQLGLNDRWIAREGVRPPAAYARPGHQRFAPYEYLARRRVTFVIGTPTLVARGSLSKPSPLVTSWLRTCSAMPCSRSWIGTTSSPCLSTSRAHSCSGISRRPRRSTRASRPPAGSARRSQDRITSASSRARFRIAERLASDPAMQSVVDTDC